MALSSSAAGARTRVSPTGPQISNSESRSPAERELESLARALSAARKNQRSNASAAASRLASFARAHSGDELGGRAALALGYGAYRGGHYAEAREWLRQASNETLLDEYVLYWSAESEQQLAHNSEALADWRQFMERHPRSILADSALESFATLAIQQNNVSAVLGAFQNARLIDTNPRLLFLRGRARAVEGQSVAAVQDFQTVYYSYPLSGAAQDAGEQLAFLRGPLGTQFPAIAPQQQLSRANALFNAHRWREARLAYLDAIPVLGAPQNELAILREARCSAEAGAGPAALTSLHLTDADVDAERLAALTELYRSRHDLADMLSSADAASARAPNSAGAASALFTVGNYYWVQLDRARAAEYYDRAAKASPGTPDAAPAAWRAAWSAFLLKSPDAAQHFNDVTRQYPSSGFLSDALYWSGRLAERDGHPALARAYYLKVQERFAQSYFGMLGAERLRTLGTSPVDAVPLLDEIPPVAPAPSLDSPVPPQADDHVARARALESIALDTFALQEFRQAWTETGAPRLLLEAARAADLAEHYGAAIITIRQLYPEIEDRRFDDVPREVWLAGYPLPYLPEINQAGTEMGIDPMLTAGLIRQESAFDASAHSGAGAIGLMQLEPKTARILCRKLRMTYSKARLTDPEYNLRLGSAYFAQLLSALGSREAALAAYNAGEDRVYAWRASVSSDDPAEFVESIPFSETRDYVQIVIRNAAIYRRLYASSQAISSHASRP